jgi:hypothetical protein
VYVGFQETLFNAVAAFLYFSSSSYLSYAVNIFLKPLYVVTPFFQVYPAMTGSYVSSAAPVCVLFLTCAILSLLRGGGSKASLFFFSIR